jgi:branched-chain amino acid transport system substrate-binding protein
VKRFIGFTRRRRGRLVGLSGVLGLVVVAVSVASSSASVTNRNVLAPGTITVGYDESLTGGYAYIGVPALNTVKMVAADINAKGGIGGKVKIKIIAEDNKTELPTVVTIANDLVDKKVNILLGNIDSGFSIAIASVAQRAQLPMLVPFEANVSIFKNYPVAYGTGQAGNAQVAVAADFMKSQGWKTIYIENAPDLAYWQSFTQYMNKAAKTRGLKVVGTGIFTSNQTDFTPQITQIRRLKPDVIYTAMYSPFVGTFLKQIRAAGIKSAFMGTDAMDNPLTLSTAGKKAIEGAYDVIHGYPTPGSGTARLYAEYKRKYRKAPQGNSFVLEAYNEIKALEALVLKAKSTKPAAMLAALKTGLTVQGAQGPFTIKAGQHYALKPIAIVRWHNGKAKLIGFRTPTNVPS